MNYALVEDNIVVNIIVLLPAAVSDFPNAYPIDGIPVQIGDRLDRGVFTRGGEKVLSEVEEMRLQLSRTQDLYDELLVEQLTEQGVLVK